MSKSRGILGRFFAALWGALNWTRLIVINLLFLLFAVFLISALLPKSPGPMPESGALRVEIAGLLVDQRSTIDPVAELFTQVQGGSGETVVRDVVRAISSGAEDPRITKLVLDLRYFAGGGISKLEEIGQALTAFKASGKQIVAFSDNYSQTQYYLASYADRVYLHPMGAVLITGFGSYRNYFQEALAKLEVNMHIFRVGEYKDAVEPYIRGDMSEESREHNSEWLSQLWDVYTSRVEGQRQLPSGAINDYVNNLDAHLNSVQGDAAQLALNFRLVDELASSTQVQEMLMDELGLSEETDSFAAVDYGVYLYHLDRQPKLAPNTIGLIVASGTIYDGEQPPGNIGGDTLANLIRESRETRDIQALVLRIDSGGGSAFASELIRNELVATRAQGIPVIVSMGDVAASGGYWIAANADEIWATPTTITGSIGVFAVLPTFENSLAKLGITTDGVGTTELADVMRLDRPLSPLAENVLQQNVESIYGRFINLVAEGRNTEAEDVRPVAGGRVWTGTTAQELGLVDHLGYLEDAIVAAAGRLDGDYQVELIEPLLTPWEQLLRNLTTASVGLVKKVALNEVSALFPQTSTLAHLSEGPLSELKDLGRLISNATRLGEVYAFCLHCNAPQ